MQYTYYVHEKKAIIYISKLNQGVSVLSIDFKPEGKLFQIMAPEYVMLCLKISWFGLGVINE